MSKLVFTVEEAKAIVREDAQDWSQKEEILEDSSRWSLSYRAIHEHLPTGKFYKFYYNRGATEQQYEGPYEYDEGTIEAFEVVQKEVLVKMWVSVDD